MGSLPAKQGRESNIANMSGLRQIVLSQVRPWDLHQKVHDSKANNLRI